MFPDSSIQDSDSPETISPSAVGSAPASRQDSPAHRAPRHLVSARNLVLVTLVIVGLAAGYMAFFGGKASQPYPATTALPGQGTEAGEPAGAIRPAAAASAPAAPVITLATVANAVGAVLERVNTAVTDVLTQQAETNRKIDQLSQDVAAVVASIKEREAKEAQRQAALVSPRPVAAARNTGKAKVATATASSPQARLLAVDIWDDQASVAIGTTTDRRVKFLNPSDSIGAISVVSANPSTQTATLQVGDRSVVLQRDQ